MDTAQWPQGIVVKPSNGTTNPQKSAGGKINGVKEGVNCPRCNSTNTKFCYYNNYSLTQPRYFCKTCRRYWTEGGTLRNIPVGGGSRKNKRPSSSSASSFSSVSPNTSKKLLPGLVSSSSNYSAAPSLPSSISSTKIAAPQNPKMMMMNQEEGHDLNGQMVFPRSFTELMHNHHHQVQPTIAVDDHHDRNNQVSALELLNRSSGGLNSNSGSFMHSHDHGHGQGQDAGFDNYTSGLSFLQHQDFKPSSSSSSLSFSLEGVGLGRPALLFPFEDLKQVPTIASNGKANDDHDDHGRAAAADSSGYWTGMLGGGSW